MRLCLFLGFSRLKISQKCFSYLRQRNSLCETGILTAEPDLRRTITYPVVTVRRKRPVL